MDTITLKIGCYTVGNGFVQDNTRTVKFEGKRLAQRTDYEAGFNDLSDTRGTTETLYETDDGRLVVYVEEWSRWQGEPNIMRLHRVDEADLGVNGKFEALGREAGYGRPLTLDEALSS